MTQEKSLFRQSPDDLTFGDSCGRPARGVVVAKVREFHLRPPALSRGFALAETFPKEVPSNAPVPNVPTPWDKPD